jgi:hypothetical protein
MEDYLSNTKTKQVKKWQYIHSEHQTPSDMSVE